LKDFVRVGRVQTDEAKTPLIAPYELKGKQEMGKNLVIVESPAKAKTIGKFLGSEYVVKSSMGHIRDLPVKSLGVDLKNSFKPSYVLVKKRGNVVNELKSAAKTCDAVYLAPDPDREGEAIAWHLGEILDKGDGNRRFYRVQYNEITQKAVRDAFDNPGEIDMGRVNAQQARRVLDRMVGYMVSPLLWKGVKRGLSAGRVQSVALRLACEREQAIRDFKPEAYWVFGAIVRKLVVPLEPFNVRLAKIDGEKAEVKAAEAADRIKADLDGAPMRVSKVSTRMIARKAYPPFITSTLQQAASTFCGFSPKRTMGIAQKLYEGVNLGRGAEGLITYMRTDSVNVSAEAATKCRKFISDAYGKDYCPDKPNVYRSRSGAQEAHEAIRPTNVENTPEKIRKNLDAAEFKLYRLIWQRFVGSQMPPARIEQRTAEITAQSKVGEGDAKATTYLFRATASETRFPGHRKVTGESEKKTEDGDAIDFLPALEENEPLSCIELLSERKETKPPSRYSEASLVKELEGNGVGRPSTYAQILSTLQQRKYVDLVKRSLIPTDLGMQTNAFLVADLSELFDVTFTASMEEALDEVEKGSVDWTQMLTDFYERFSVWLENAKPPPADSRLVHDLLAGLSEVKEWAPPVKRGKRTYDDEKFITSIADALDEGKDISLRQLGALVRIAVRYKEQAPKIEELLKATEFADALDDPSSQPPQESTLLKMEFLKTQVIEGSAKDFVESLTQQAAGGRRLSLAQLKALDSIVLTHALKLEDADAMLARLSLKREDVPVDNESATLLELMKTVSDWKPPVKRGKREFNDKSFYESLSRQFAQRTHLSDRQRAALKRMIRRYREQIPGFNAVADRYGLRKPDRRDQK